MLLGDFENFMNTSAALDQNLYFIILLAMTVYIVIVMLNLLIAIISDSFEKIMAIEKQGELYEKLKIICDYMNRQLTQNKKIGVQTNNEAQERFLFQLFKDEAFEGEFSKERLRTKIEKIERVQDLQNANMNAKIDRMEDNLMNEIQNFKRFIEGSLSKISKSQEKSLEAKKLSNSLYNVVNEVLKIKKNFIFYDENIHHGLSDEKPIHGGSIDEEPIFKVLD